MAKSKETNLQETAPTDLAEKQVSALIELPEQPGELISDDKVVDYYEEAMACIKEDREEAHDRYLDFCEMVINEGDPSSATKDALVSLLKLKNDSVDQMIKILDLWTRLKMKDRATNSQIYAYQQNNRYEGSARGNPNVKKLIKMAQEMENPE